MRFTFFLFFITFSFNMIGQDIGFIKNGNHSMKLIKEDDNYMITYSDIASKKSESNEKTIQFREGQYIYDIIMMGFKNKKGHQIILDVGNDTIVKLDYHLIKGENLLRIRQSNFVLNTAGTSGYFKESDFKQLFGNFK